MNLSSLTPFDFTNGLLLLYSYRETTSYSIVFYMFLFVSSIVGGLFVYPVEISRLLIPVCISVLIYMCGLFFILTEFSVGDHGRREIYSRCVIFNLHGLSVAWLLLLLIFVSLLTGLVIFEVLTMIVVVYYILLSCVCIRYFTKLIEDQYL